MADETPKVGPLEPADESTLTAAPGMVQFQLTARAGDRFGRYKILEEIGQGGCGAVFIAEQEEPVRRRVALKVIKLGMDTRQVIARFEAERQALAMMEHPNIAKVLDAGATDTGRPFFVMELVRGIRITDYCDQNKLSTPERLKLFIQVCQAVQHAHQKGIIHRDLKPSNILVTIHDGLPTPKVIDFGIAKATADQKLTDKTVYTAFEQFIGTPAYMSPEQAEMAGLDIDTRSDIYSLGVLLYELLVGETPFSSEELLSGGLDVMRRTLREKDPTRPSTKLSMMTDADLTAIAQHRQSEPPKLIKSVRGDLDWIVMKCLEKDRTRRYEAANGLGADIVRYLKSEPVIARPPSRLYEFQKTVHRHKFGFAVAAALILVLAIGIVASSYEAVCARRAETVANHNQQLAETEAAKSKQVAEFLQGMLNGVGPAVALGRDTTMLREILDQSADNVSKALKNQPAVEAELETTIGKAYYAIGEDGKAKANLENAVALRRKVPGGNSVELAYSLQELAMVRWRQSSLEAAEELAREALAMKRRFLGAGHPAVADSLDTLGTVLNSQNKLGESEAVLREALAIRSKEVGGENLAFAETLGNLSAVLQRRGAMDEAEAMARKSLVVKKKLLDVHPSVATALNSLGYTLLKENKLEEAEGLLREGLAMRRKLLGKEHPELALSLINLADTLAGRGKLEEAEGMARESLAMRRSLGLTNDLESAGYLNHVAATLRLRNKFSEAEELLLQALAIERKATKKPGRTQGYTLTQLGDDLRDEVRLGRKSEAIALCDKELTETDTSYGKQSAEAADWRMRMSDVLREAGDFARAETLLLEALETLRKVPHTDERALDTALGSLANLQVAQGKIEQAEATRREELALERKLSGNEHLFVANSMIDLGLVLLNEGKYSEAETNFQQALAIRRKLLGNKNAEVADTLVGIGRALEGLEKVSEAETHYREGFEMEVELFGLSDPRTEPFLGRLGACLVSQGKISSAKAVYCEAAERGNTFGQGAAAWLMATGPADVRDGQRAVDFSEKAVSKTARTNASYLATLAAALAETGEFARAVGVQKEAVATLRDDNQRAEYQSRLNLYESAVPYRNDSMLAQLAKSLLDEAKFVEAERVARECLTYRERELPDDWHTFNTRSMLGGALLGQKRFAEAEPLLLSGYEGMNQRRASMPSIAAPRPREALQRLVELYEQTSRTDQAEDYKKKLAECR